MFFHCFFLCILNFFVFTLQFISLFSDALATFLYFEAGSLYRSLTNVDGFKSLQFSPQTSPLSLSNAFLSSQRHCWHFAGISGHLDQKCWQYNSEWMCGVCLCVRLTNKLKFCLWYKQSFFIEMFPAYVSKITYNELWWNGVLSVTRIYIIRSQRNKKFTSKYALLAVAKKECI